MSSETPTVDQVVEPQECVGLTAFPWILGPCQGNDREGHGAWPMETIYNDVNVRRSLLQYSKVPCSIASDLSKVGHARFDLDCRRSLNAPHAQLAQEPIMHRAA
jgi:hypothetical protein